MLTVTDAATEHLAQILEENELPEEVAVRFVIEGQGVALQQDKPQEGDTTFEHGGRTVLLLDNQVADLLTEHTLDLEDSKLTLRHPNEDA